MKKIMVIILFASIYGEGMSQDKIRSDSSKWTSSPYKPLDTAKSSAKKPGHEISTSQRYDPFDTPRVSGKKPHEVGSSTPYHPLDSARTSSGKPKHTIDSSTRYFPFDTAMTRVKRAIPR